MTLRQTLKTIYRRVPFKRQLFTVVKTFVTPSENVYKHLHFQDDFRVCVDETHSFQMRHGGLELENTLFWVGPSGGWEKNSMSIWIKLVKNADVIFDVGANTGYYSLVAKALNPKAKIYAFEPIAESFHNLEYNNRINNFDIACFDCAASNVDGEANIFSAPDDFYAVTLNKDYLDKKDISSVPTTIKVARLDTLIEELKIEKIDLIKLDVETYEAEVLEGLGKYLDKFRPTLLIEILNDDVGHRIEALIKGKDYLYFNIDEETDSIRQVEQITKSDYYNYLICNRKVAAEVGLI
jgi:FkbM family methyltransferase